MKELLQTLTKRKYREIVCKTTDGSKFLLQFSILNECRISLEFDADNSTSDVLASIDNVLRAYKEHKLLFTPFRHKSNVDVDTDEDGNDD
jgi:hypothetical protein